MDASFKGMAKASGDNKIVYRMQFMQVPIEYSHICPKLQINYQADDGREAHIVSPRQCSSKKIFLMEDIGNPLLYTKMWWKWPDIHAAVLWKETYHQRLIFLYLKFVHLHLLIWITRFWVEEIWIWKYHLLNYIWKYHLFINIWTFTSFCRSSWKLR